MLLLDVFVLLLMTAGYKDVDAFGTTTLLAKMSSERLFCFSSSFVENEECKQKCKNRRKLFIKSAHVPFMIATIVPFASAANLPQSTGADLSRTGTRDALVPIIAIKKSLESIKSQLVSKGDKLLPEECKSIIRTLQHNIPRDENDFKRIFDSYSTPVSYKQKFLDQNAFLVYYTKGFDGQGRPNIEDDAVNNIQTLQYGMRNDVWVAMDDLYVELEFAQRTFSELSVGELKSLLEKVLLALDDYLRLAPATDVEQASATYITAN